ncbi:hypothetical protein X956_02340 [Trueperella pyogenes TP8]|nr:hypothetical protein X956_02340 [Trueperella pyogenes TP8]
MKTHIGRVRQLIVSWIQMVEKSTSNGTIGTAMAILLPIIFCLAAILALGHNGCWNLLTSIQMILTSEDMRGNMRSSFESSVLPEFFAELPVPVWNLDEPWLI